MDIKKLIDSAAALPPFYADVCMLAAGEIKELRAKLEDPDIANLRGLEASVKNLIAALSRHDTGVLREPLFDSTISGDLYATVASVVFNCWDHVTLSDLQRRYPLPQPIDAAPTGHDGGRELPGVRGEVPDGGGSAEHRGVCGSADEQPDLTPEQQGLALTAEQLKLCDLFDSQVRRAAAGQFQADLLRIINAAKERKTYTADMVQAMMLHCHSAAGTLDSALDPPPAWMQEALEQARSTTRRNILAALQGGVFPPPGLPQQDVAVAIAILQRKVESEHKTAERVQFLEGKLSDMRAQRNKAVGDLCQRETELLGTIKGRDKTIDRLCRYIAFGVAK